MEAVSLDNMEIVRRAIEAADNNDNELWAQFVGAKAVMHPQYDSYDDFKDEQTGYEFESNIEEDEERSARYLEQFSQARTTVDEMFESGDDKVVTVYTSTSTHRSGKQVTVKGIAVERIANGKIVEGWYSWDRLGYWQQLGLVPHVRELLAQRNRQ